MTDVPIKRVLLDGVPTWKYRCPLCHTCGYIDDEQFKGQVSIQCAMPGCSYHETLDLMSWMGKRLADQMLKNAEP